MELTIIEKNRLVRDVGYYFFVLLPAAGVIAEFFMWKSGLRLSELMLKWFVFSGVGLRLFTAGLKQTCDPAFTSKKIFKINDEACLPVVREIGLADISFGTIGLLSFVFPELRIASAASGGLYLGLAGIAHLVRKQNSGKETFAMISDLYIFAVLIILIIAVHIGL